MAAPSISLTTAVTHTSATSASLSVPIGGETYAVGDVCWIFAETLTADALCTSINFPASATGGMSIFTKAFDVPLLNSGGTQVGRAAAGWARATSTVVSSVTVTRTGGATGASTVFMGKSVKVMGCVATGDPYEDCTNRAVAFASAVDWPAATASGTERTSLIIHGTVGANASVATPASWTAINSNGTTTGADAGMDFDKRENITAGSYDPTNGSSATGTARATMQVMFIATRGGGDTPISIGPITLDLTPTLSRVVSRKPTVALTTSVTVSRQVSRNVSLAMTLPVSVKRVINRNVSLALSTAVSLSRVVQRAVSTALTFTPSVAMVKSFVQNISLALTLNPSVSRVVNRNATTALTLTPSVSRVINRSIPLALSLTASVSRTVQRTVSTALTLVPSVIRVIDRKLATALTFTASAALIRALSMSINVAFTLSTSVSRVVQRNASVSLQLEPTVSRVVNRSIAAALDLVPTVVRVIERKINTALVFAASATPTFVPVIGTIFPINVSVPLQFAVSVTKDFVAARISGAVHRVLRFGRRGIY